MPKILEMTESMRCPHCHEFFMEPFKEHPLGSDKDSIWWIRTVKCPACMQFVLFLRRSIRQVTRDREESNIMLWPRAAARRLPPEVPADFAADFQEACLVLPDGAKASAALSRRCLQRLLRERAGVKPSDLANEIQQVLDARGMPPYLAEAIDAVRNVGNFAAHPIKSKNTAEIIDVEPGEAEWLLDTLESLFVFYFVQPEVLKRKRDALNHKLSDAGKPPMK